MYCKYNLYEMICSPPYRSVQIVCVCAMCGSCLAIIASRSKINILQILCVRVEINFSLISLTFHKQSML